MKRQKKIPYYFNLILLLLTLLAFLVIGEIATRSLGFPPRVDDFFGDIVKHRPYAKWVHRKENTNFVRLNNMGFHDKNRELSPKNYRILILGDSFVEGLQVPKEQVFTALLERKFYESGKMIEVMNGGMSGTGTLYQYRLWKDFFKDNVKMNHLILCIFMGNDLENNHPPLAKLLGTPPNNSALYFDEMGQVSIDRVEYGLLQKIFRILTKHSAFANFLYQRLFLIKRTFLTRTLKETSSSNSNTQENSNIIREAWLDSINQTLGLIAKRNEELKSQSIDFSVVIIPDAKQAEYGGYNNNNKKNFAMKTRDWCKKENVGFLELKYKQNPFELFSFDGKTFGHFNYEGHRITAEKLFSWLRNLVPSTGNKLPST